MDIRFHYNVHAANAIQLDLFILVTSPVAHASHVRSAGIVLFIPLCEHDVPVEGVGKTPAPIGLDPAVVVEAAFDVAIVFIAMEPDIYSYVVSFLGLI